MAFLINDVNRYLMYLRKSRAEEHETVEEVLSRHEKQLQEYALRQFGQYIPEKNIYREVVSGETISGRPQMQEVLKKIETQLYEGVIVIEPQRLSRGDMLDAGTIVRAFQYTNTKILTPQKAYDLEDKFDRKFFEMELRQGNDYLEYIKEILQRGRLHSVKQGNYVASHSPFGYKKVKDGKNFTLEIVESEAETIRLIFDMFVNQKIGVSNISKELNRLGIKPPKAQRWYPDALRTMLHNPLYIGKIRWNDRKTVRKYEDGKIIKSSPRNRNGEDYILVDGKHPAIIDEETFNVAQTLFGHPIKITNNRELRCIFAGFIHCECGFAMTYRSNGTKCLPRLVCNNQVNCGNQSAVYKSVEEAVRKTLIETLEELQAIYKGDKSKKESYKTKIVNSIKKDIEKVEEQRVKLYEFLEEGIYTKDVFKARMKLLEENLKRLEMLLKEAEESVQEKNKYREGIIKLTKAIEAIDDRKISAKQKNAILSEVIEDITYSRKVPSDRRHYHDVPFKLDVKLKI